MRLLAIDPGYANCGWVLFENFKPTRFGGWFFKSSSVKMSAFHRSLLIIRGLQTLTSKYQIDSWATERYFTQPKISQHTNYDRGIFDGLLRFTLGHLHGYSIAPGTMKKWITGSGKAKKELVLAEANDWLHNTYPEFYMSLTKGHVTDDREHMLEAAVIGDITCWLYRTRRAETAPTPAKREVLRAVEKQTDTNIEPHWNVPVPIPRYAVD